MSHFLRRFNVRVYGILMNENDQVLVADEVFMNGGRATKFPGGGLELGEGLIDGIVREMKEETGVNVTVVQHFYTTDFFQPSYFDNESQILSIYYLLQSNECANIKVSEKKFDFSVLPGMEAESFRWVSIQDLQNESTISLPIDKVVVKMIQEEFPKVGFRIPSKG